jgi:hypothetical protein
MYKKKLVSIFLDERSVNSKLASSLHLVAPQLIWPLLDQLKVGYICAEFPQALTLPFVRTKDIIQVCLQCVYMPKEINSFELTDL